MSDAESLARSLHDAERAAAPIEPLTAGHPGLTVDEAYAVQLAGRGLRLAEGRRVAGHKIGLTSEAIQRQLGVDQPDYGYLLDSMLVADGVEIDVSRLIAPRVEGEIAFVLADDLEGDVTVEQVLAATAEVAPALEIIDSRIADWRIALEDTIADNASSALGVIGRRLPIGGLDLAEMTMHLTVGDAVAARAGRRGARPPGGVGGVAGARARSAGRGARGGRGRPLRRAGRGDRRPGGHDRDRRVRRAARGDGELPVTQREPLPSRRRASARSVSASTRASSSPRPSAWRSASGRSRSAHVRTSSPTCRT